MENLLDLVYGIKKLGDFKMCIDNVSYGLTLVPYDPVDDLVIYTCSGQ